MRWRRWIRRLAAKTLGWLPWSCHGLLVAWGELGGWRLLREAIRFRAARECMADANHNGTCYCYRFGVVPGSRVIYQATPVDRDSLLGVGSWTNQDG